MSEFDTSKFIKQGLSKINFQQIENTLKTEGIKGLATQKENITKNISEHMTSKAFDYVDVGIETLADSVATFLGFSGNEAAAVGLVVLKDLGRFGFENFMKTAGLKRKPLQVGDYCAVLKGYKTFRELDSFIQDGQEAVYKKKTQKNVDVAIVMSVLDNEMLEIIDLNTGEKENVAKMDCVAFTSSQLEAIRGTEFEKVRSLILREQIGIQKINKPTSGKVIHELEEYEIIENRGEHVVIQNKKNTKEVPRSELQFAWGRNSTTDMGESFVQNGHDIAPGEFVYCQDDLCVVHSMRFYEYYVCSCSTGEFEFVALEDIERVNQSNFVGPVFTQFKINVMEGNEVLLKQNPISNTFPDICKRKNYHSDGMEFPAVTRGNLLMGAPHSHQTIQNAPVKSPGSGYYTEPAPTNNTHIIVIAAVAALFIGFSLSK